MSGSLTYGDGENIPGIPGACAPAILRIWQEAHTSNGLVPSVNKPAPEPNLTQFYVTMPHHLVTMINAKAMQCVVRTP